MKRRFTGTSTRLNVAANNETYIHKNGRAFLKEKVLSDVVREGAIFDEVQKHHPWVEQLQEITVQQIKAENACHNQPSNIVLMEQMYENTLFKEEYEKLKETKEHNNTSHEVKSVLRSLLPNAEDLNTRNNPQQIYNKLHNEILLFK